MFNPRRPHDYQITDSQFDVRFERGSWFVVESWWQIDRSGESEERDTYSAAFATEAEARALLEADVAVAPLMEAA